MLDKFYNETLHKLETAINELEIEADNCSIQRVEAIIQLIIQTLSKLKEYVLKRGFKILMRKSIFSNIRNLPSLQSSFITMLCIRLKPKDLMAEKKFWKNISIKNYQSSKGFLITIWRFTAITEPTALILTTPILFVASTMFN